MIPVADMYCDAGDVNRPTVDVLTFPIPEQINALNPRDIAVLI